MIIPWLNSGQWDKIPLSTNNGNVFLTPKNLGAKTLEKQVKDKYGRLDEVNKKTVSI